MNAEFFEAVQKAVDAFNEFARAIAEMVNQLADGIVDIIKSIHKEINEMPSCGHSRYAHNLRYWRSRRMRYRKCKGM